MTRPDQDCKERHALAAVSYGVYRRISSSKVRDLCGGVTDMTIYRWLNDPRKDFPKPIYIGNRRYWRESDVIAWLDRQADEQRGSA